MTLETKYTIDEKLYSEVVNDKAEKKSPKMIHSFWFSGEDKPDSYKKCVDSWAEILDDYEIIEWNQDNYDWKKHPFLKKAIELKAWAYASDYARLDVLYRMGGIYLDMDVEVFKKFDDLLNNEAILSFSSPVQIDLAVMASCKGNLLVNNLLLAYDDLIVPKSREEYAKYFQPALVRNILVDCGIEMNGNLQKVSEATVFPTEFFMPQDVILFSPYIKTNNTYAVHYDNFGWSFSKDNKREKKTRDNNKLWELIETI
ncbi:MAG: glycosyltransferase [Bacillota bacterium]|nr:glycosyltransferase [Bacillota bacterium]